MSQSDDRRGFKPRNQAAARPEGRAASSFAPQSKARRERDLAREARQAAEGPVPEGRLVCGLQPVREAIRAHGGKLYQVLLEHGDSPTLEALGRFAADQGIRVERGSRGMLDRFTEGARHQGAVAFAPPLVVLDSTEKVSASTSPAPLVLCLDELEDPQNFGAIVRSAVALSATCVVWPEHHSAPLSPAMFRASAGAVEHATLVRVKALPNELQDLKDRGFTVIGLDADARHSLVDADLTGPVAIVVGSEGKGLRKPVKQACTRLAKLPMARTLGSLNASVAAAIALYEANRQRRGASPEGAPSEPGDGEHDSTEDDSAED